MIDFFDSKATSWDQQEIKSQEEISSFISKLPIEEGMKVLDIGCGTGIITGDLYRLSKNEVIGIDISSKMIDIARKKYKSNSNIKFECGDFLKMNRPLFDCEIIFNAYPHFLDRNALKEALFNSLVSNGIFIFAHNFSRLEINSFHKDCMLGLSRTLLPVKEESSFFEDKFEVIEAIENTNFYLIICKKKG
jgi:demethylmenaquinone methyltransferase/2-methoxy-6-polyprenyl-1,4-benzoquinol methylase